MNDKSLYVFNPSNLDYLFTISHILQKKTIEEPLF